MASLSGWLHQTKTHIIHIVYQPFSRVTPPNYIALVKISSYYNYLHEAFFSCSANTNMSLKHLGKLNSFNPYQKYQHRGCCQDLQQHVACNHHDWNLRDHEPWNQARIGPQTVSQHHG